MKTACYSDFWRRLHESARKENLPLRIMFELTYDCNFKCGHCYVPESCRREYRSKELGTMEVFGILRQLRDAGCFYLGFTGGEPFKRKDMFKILDYTRRLGFEVMVNTNASLLDNKLIEKIKYLNLNKIDITIPAFSTAAFEKITGVKGSREKVFNNIISLHEHGVNLGFKTCVLKENKKEIRLIKSFCRSLKAQHRLSEILLPEWEESTSLSLRERLAEGRVRATGHASRYTKPHKKKIFPCGTGSSQAAITPAGELKLCVMLNFPKYKIKVPLSLREKGGGEEKHSGISLNKAWAGLGRIADSIEREGNKSRLRLESKEACNAFAFLRKNA